ncbi:MAG: cellulase family glycosylhydrolase [Acidobacteriaceae bacterium]|nr:cellulase family glycosylhydrolase [Acidobacteriaceae bacterium]MBV9767285.1 cellulase family glycosylhydrolase [Acidobacteriaceae bacterium]
MKRKLGGFALCISFVLSALLLARQQPASQPGERWTQSAANAWYEHQPWLVGSNYLPADAINELEMWQADTFDPKRIDTELGWAEGLGMNTMRVFLHDLLWKQDSEGFKKRINTFLEICDRHKIKPLFVLFDSCWDPFPHLGKQREPRPGVHNSGWVQSPGAEALQDPSQYPRLEAYVKGVVGAFAKDNRILGWDVWNEPDNQNGGSYGAHDPKNKTDLILALVPQAFAWARSAQPEQPLTSAIFHEDPSAPDTLSAMAKKQFELSDVISFHNYDPPAKFEEEVKWLQQYGRPLICTEYMARPRESTFENILPVAKKYKVGAINWGFVAGKSQTYMPWDSWQHPYVDHPPRVWFHDIFHKDGTPYRPAEVAFIRNITGKSTE